MARPLKAFMRGKSIRLLQEVLRRRGYVIDDADGLFGVTTRDAVKNFQKQHGLKTSGEVDAELMNQLQQGSVPPAVKPEPKAEVAKAAEAMVPQKDFDALLRLLRKKGVIEDGEFEAELARLVPRSL